MKALVVSSEGYGGQKRAEQTFLLAKLLLSLNVLGVFIGT